MSNISQDDPATTPAVGVDTDVNGEAEAPAAPVADNTCDMTLLIPQQTFFPISPPSVHADSKTLPGHFELAIPMAFTDPVHELRQLIVQEPEGFWLGGFGLKPVYCDEIKAEAAKEGEEEKPSEWTAWKDLEEPKEDPDLVVDPKMWRLTPEGVLDEFADLGTVFGGDWEGRKRGLKVVRTSFTPLSMSLHMIRIRDTLYASLPNLSTSGTYDPTSIAISPGASIYRSIRGEAPKEAQSAPQETQPEKTTEPKANGKGKKSKGKKAETSAPEPTPAPTPAPVKSSQPHPFTNFSLSDLNAFQYLSNLKPAASPALSTPCLRSFGLSAWSPPPHARRMRGDLVYLAVTTLEGESYHVTGALSGFWVSKSSNMTFDPSPRTPAPEGLKETPYQSFYELACALSPAFIKNLSVLLATQTPAGTDIFATFPISHALPAAPWLVPNPQHSSDPFRTQLAYLLTTSISGDQLPPARDWNEEFGQFRCLPRKTQQESLLRERLIARVQADFVAAGIRGAVSISRGDVPPLNPEERQAAHTFAHNGMLFTRAEDALGAFKHLGGDDASHVAAGKDLKGIEIIDKADVAGLETMATMLVDYLGERWICQTLIPGFFKTKELDEQQEQLRQILPEESNAVKEERKKAEEEGRPFPNETTPNKDDYPPTNTFRIVYGSANPEIPEETVRASKYFGSLAKQVAEKSRLAEHTIKDKNGKESKLWTSSDLHGIVSPDGRAYYIDCFRMHCTDVEFLENNMEGPIFTDAAAQSGTHTPPSYPHRLVLLRDELVQSYYDLKLKAWIQEQVSEVHAKVEKEKAEEEAKKGSIEAELKDAAEDSRAPGEGGEEVPAPEKRMSTINAADFKFSFNPDAFVERAPLARGEAPIIMFDAEEESSKRVREASLFLREKVIPSFIVDLINGGSLVSDGLYLTKLMHRKGINMRYLGMVLSVLEKDGPTFEYDAKLQQAEKEQSMRSFKSTLQHEMVVRAAKHILRKLLKTASAYDHPSIIAYFFNLFTQSPSDPAPVPELIELPSGITPQRDWASFTVASLQSRLISDIEARFRYSLPASFFTETLLATKMIKELSLRVGIQLRLRDYTFAYENAPSTNGHAFTNDETVGGEAGSSKAPSKPKKKKNGPPKLPSTAALSKPTEKAPFVGEDILNIMPVAKTTAFKSATVDELYDAGQRALSQSNVELGTELIQDSLQLYEQVYGSIHPDSATRCHSVGLIYYSLYSNILQKVGFHESAAEKLEETPQAERASLLAKFTEAGIMLDSPDTAKNDASTYLDMAVRMMRQGVIIAERTLGLDHWETIRQYSDLAQVEHAVGNLDTAMRLTRHALDLWVVSAGRVHPTALELLMNAFNLVVQVENHQAALPLLQECATLAKALYGEDSSAYARTQRLFAEIYYMAGDVAKSLPYFAQALKSSSQSVGDEDGETVELRQFLTLATTQLERMSNAQKVKDDQLKKQLGTVAHKVGQRRATTAASVTPEAVAKVEYGQKANLSVEELVNYIQGAPTPVAGAGGKRKRKVSPPAASKQ